MTEGTEETVLNPSPQGSTVLSIILSFKEHAIPDHKLTSSSSDRLLACTGKNSFSADFYQVSLYRPCLLGHRQNSV